MQSVLGIAKNVNGRRAATAYHLLPGASNGSSPAAAPGEPQPLAYVSSPFDGVALPLLKSSPSASLASSFSSSSLASLGGLETASSSSHLGTPTNGSATDLVRLNSSPFISVKSSDTEQDTHGNRHGNVVDKTNPFIGYFQTGRDSTSSSQQQPLTAAKTGLPPRSTSGVASVTTPYAALLSQPKRIADWIGSQSTRLPSLFTRRETSENASQPQQQASAQQGESDGVKGMSLLSSLKAAASSLGALSRQDSEQRSCDGRTSVPPTPITSLSLKAATSRFAQDFEVLESLGQGGQGAVFKARSRIDGCVYAIKQVALSNAALDDAAELEQARREAVSMAAIPPHSNVVRYHTAWIEVEPVERVSSSTASVRGSDVPSDVENDSLELSQRDSEREDSSFSLDLSSSMVAPFEHSIDGFEFEAPSQSMQSSSSLTNDKPRDASNGSHRSELSGVGRSKLTLYIQMELCSTSTAPRGVSADEPFDRFVDRLQQRPSAPRPEQYSNLAQWLRSSVDERSARVAAKHTEGLALFLGVAQGVSHMHSVGVIHRDLKPDNIFIHGDVAKVGDFGLSKSIVADNKHAPAQLRARRGARSGSSDSDSDGDSLDHTTALGTFTYASPEQLGHRFNGGSKATSRVKSAKYSVKSDIFALGVILLELCCPFGTMMERSQVLTAVRHGVVPQRALQQFPTEMALVLRMTAVDPAERPSAEEICEQIRSLLIARNAIGARSALDELRDLQAKFALAVHQLRDRSQTTLQLESLVAEMSDKLQLYGTALA